MSNVRKNLGQNEYNISVSFYTEEACHAYVTVGAFSELDCPELEEPNREDQFYISRNAAQLMNLYIAHWKKICQGEKMPESAYRASNNAFWQILESFFAIEDGGAATVEMSLEVIGDKDEYNTDVKMKMELGPNA